MSLLYVTSDVPLLELDKTQIERKIRLVILSDLCSKSIGRDVPYSEIASTLKVEMDQVEAWVIDGEVSLAHSFPIGTDVMR